MKFAVLLSLFLLSVLSNTIESDISIDRIERMIDLTSQFAKHSITIDMTRVEKNFMFYFLIEKEMSENLVYRRASVEEMEYSVISAGEAYVVDGVVFVSYGIELPKGKNVSVQIELVFSNVLVPSPAAALQSERQLVEYHDACYWVSPYKIKSMVTVVTLGTNFVQYFTKLEPFTVSDGVVTYGPYVNVDALTYEKLSLHFENNSPFLSVSLSRTIEISHWGNIAVEDKFNIKHTGCILKGSFSRYEYKVNPMGKGQQGIKIFSISLPDKANDVYYRDEIGNISSSFLNRDQDKLRLDLAPRYPLFGGWSTDFYMGYNLPLDACLGIDSQTGKYVLDTTLLPVSDHFFFTDIKVRVILPQGSSNIEFTSPFEISSYEDIELTYLDIWGRPALNFESLNLVQENNANLQVNYSLSDSDIFIKPLLVMSTIFAVLIVVMILFRLNLIISDNAELKAEKYSLYQLEILFDERENVFDYISDALDEYLTTNDKHDYEELISLAESNLEKIYQKMHEVNHSLPTESQTLISELLIETDLSIKTLLEIHLVKIDQKTSKKPKDQSAHITKLQSDYDSSTTIASTLISSLLKQK